MPSPLDPLVGRELGPYQLADFLGAGTFGWVYRAVHKDLNRAHAIKILMPGYARDPNALDRFYQEAKLAASVQHPRIVHIYDIQREQDFAYIVMEFIDGKSLVELYGLEVQV